jgi:hypothetical protein
MDPSKINLNNVSKLFEYEKISREIDTCNDIESMKNIAKSYIKLYFAQQECILDLTIQP